ncbi:ArsR/SmtB family transcription factor [Nocardia macrotermitis]|uniref:HTH arsR-type domain-containing protein n=1 Tax=Nocardia macrotermitis TaxID=2585198 RepID=A0A7K0DA26_9NOCA|nr:helix-turn-helix transcriptional regulator [Nocardia macrotermitis]MQY22626.1 hypothetical protein [Nocardia macrotermitis]
MLRIHFTVADLARTRFLPDPAPLLETKFALLALCTRTRAPWGDRWRREAVAALPPSAGPLVEVITQFGGNLSPSATGADLAEQLDELREIRASPERTQAEMESWYGAGTGRTPGFMSGPVAEPQEGRLFCRAVESAYAAIVRPYWADIRVHYRIELAHQTRLMAQCGIGATVEGLIDGSRWRGECLEIDVPYQRTVRLRGRGLVLIPAVFWTGPPLVGELLDEPVLLTYTPRTMAPIRTSDDSDTLAAILGGTRAAVLRLLAEPHTTTDIARGLDIGLASASEHAAALRAARLIDSRRDGRAVVHRATALGVDLIEVNAPYAATWAAL